MKEKHVDANIREEYTLDTLHKGHVKPNPLDQFSLWFETILKEKNRMANAVILATVNNDNQPSQRTVLLKEYSEEGFVFYTNYTSQKGQELSQHNNASLLITWLDREREIRIQGHVHKTSEKQSDAYFYSRPLDSQYSAIASDQSQELHNRKELEDKVKDVENQSSGKPKRPETWGGYIVVPHTYEFWQGRKNRLHDRVQYKKENESWVIRRLCP